MDALIWLQASRDSDIASLQRLLKTGELMAAVSELVHRLQRERGANNLWICSGGTLFSTERHARQQEVSAGLHHFYQALPSATAQPGFSRFCNLIAAALQALAELPLLRQQISQHERDQAAAMAAFNQVIRTLLNLVFEAADTASDPDISRALIALFSFMQGKELAGQERAIGSAGFAARQFTPEQRSQMVALIAAQEQSFTTFREFADSAACESWQPLSQASRDIERLRRIACTGSQYDETGALEWFSLLSERLDQMKTLEDALTATLMQRCREAIKQAQQQAASPVVQSDSNFSLYVCGADWLPGASTLSSDGLAPQLGRSVLSLIGEQSQRLQQQADELASMRASLDERRVIDQAKHWLMQQQGFTEEAAWQALRKSAMNQNKRVLEIAQAVLAVAKTLSN
ncbi:nitrate- and nitrite sensing domain-containing protein [Pantoea sp. JKS000250]|uniref:nitrate- and nitrite sensing domain-containing protein n=1 Tax=Pantoea sp. JKS000250 TaxID=1938795 RepID=UPI000D76E427|nr:nitrate regulatory protein [Pantoea sp. JKS000250]PXW22087.1 ANTAR domain-containing protein [Pantoea sp. JKS000250]